jgi:hypothetical protein
MPRANSFVKTGGKGEDWPKMGNETRKVGLNVNLNVPANRSRCLSLPGEDFHSQCQA